MYILMSAENSDKAYLLGLMLENDSYGDIYKKRYMEKLLLNQHHIKESYMVIL